MPSPSSGIVLPLSYARDTGDLDHMVKRRNIRALLIMNPIGFFYDKGLPRGVMYEALQEFQKFVNTRLKTHALAVKVTFVPVRIDQVESALTEGVGDIVAFGVVVTPEREQRVAFSSPIATDVTQIIVTGSSFGHCCPNSRANWLAERSVSPRVRETEPPDTLDWVPPRTNSTTGDSA